MKSTVLLIAIGLAVTLSAPAARATFPGKNGHVAYTGTLGAIFLDGTQLTHPETESVPPNDFWPAVSPDGKRVAFVRQIVVPGVGYNYLVEVIDAAGTQLPQTLAGSLDFSDAGSFGTISDLAWTNEGRISFVINSGGTPAQTANNGIYTLDYSGSRNPRIVDFSTQSASGLSWSPIDKEAVYECSFRTSAQGAPLYDLCIWDDASHRGRQMPLDFKDSAPASLIFHPKWTADGEQILFERDYSTFENGHFVGRIDVYAVSAAGGRPTKLTDSGPDVCPQVAPRCGGSATYKWVLPSPSPDGGSFLVNRIPGGYEFDPATGCGCANPGGGPTEVDVVSLAGGGTGHPVTTTGLNAGVGTDWQPIPTNLIVDVDDGRDHALKGLKLELQLPTGTVAGTNTAGGTYTFDGVPNGTYTIRATLVDTPSDGSTAAFDMRHAAEPDTPVWVERSVKVKVGATLSTVLHFAASSEITATSIQDSTNRQRLTDIAAIYWRTRQYVDWVKANLVSNTGDTVEYYTFADVDPFPVCIGGTMERYGCNTDTDCPGGTCGFDTVAPDAVYYQPSGSYVVIGTDNSAYSARDQAYDSDQRIGDEGPENVEWHEFTHHLYHTRVNNEPCVGDTAHGGYLNNPDTCDSMDEGFASFLPTFAAHDLLGQTDTHYDDIAPSLEAHDKAWVVQPGDKGELLPREDIAVAAVLWDLTDASPDVENTEIIGQDGLNHLVTYIDTEQMTLQDLWTVLSNTHPTTLRAFRNTLGTVLSSSDTAISVDLDADGIPDVSPLDEVFLMHGFYPIDAQQLALSKKYRYDVGAAQKEDPTVPRDAAVGSSDHYIQGQANAILETFVPRSNTPTATGANLGVTVQDASGRTLSGASIDLTLSYPGVPSETRTVMLGAANGALVHLELPPYYDYLLPVGAPLPACDPTTDVQVNVSLQTRLNGYVSNDVTSFDNCAYQQAIAAATGNAAMTITSTFPDDSTAPVSEIITTPSDALIGGATVGVWIVRFTCDDPADSGFASGCDHTEYSLDGGPLTTYQQRVIVDGIGSHTLQYRSIDAAGNQEAFQSVDLDVAPVPAPTITGVSPSSGIFGSAICGVGVDPRYATTVMITGTDLDRTTAVSFNGTSAPFSLYSDTQVNATVPVGATTGPITVTSAGGTATTTDNFVVIQPPTITGFSPASGNVNTFVTITGTNFDTTNNVYFNNQPEGWRVDSSTQLTTLIVNATTTGPIQVQTQAGIACSPTDFIIAIPTTTTTSTTTTTLKGHKTTTTTTFGTTTTTPSSSTTTTLKTRKTTTTSTTTTLGSTTTTTPGMCGSPGAACAHSSDCCSGTCIGKTKTCK